jgi:hypothetical protein
MNGVFLAPNQESRFNRCAPPHLFWRISSNPGMCFGLRGRYYHLHGPSSGPGELYLRALRKMNDMALMAVLPAAWTQSSDLTLACGPMHGNGSTYVPGMKAS